MPEKPIKVDEQTDRIVADLAHFMRTTKKSVVRDAVAEYAEARRGLLAPATGGVSGLDELAPLQRLALRRKELIREFARRQGTDIRVFQAADGEDDEITLLVETDPIDGSAAAPRLAEIAQRLLDVHVTVISSTALRLMRPEQHRRALELSQPL
ncbi:MAG TPA: hypothetical protein VFM66_09630 [Agromyces sp.]|nr:hypothetical protein [Agromyces sp.]